MLNTFIEFSRYFAALLFGAAVAVSFAGMPKTRKNNLIFGSFVVFIFILQFISLILWGMEKTVKLYPLYSHLPVVIFIALYLKRSWLTAFVSMFLSFLCCQPPRWAGTICGDIFGNVTMNHLGYILSALIIYYLLEKYIVTSVRHLMNRSVKSVLFFGAIPAFYYIFDHTTTVYSNFLYSGTRAAIQFMPFVTSAFYFVFVLLFYGELQKQEKVQKERDLIDMQFRLAQKEFTSLRELQENAASYRHDMRHHIHLLQALAENGKLEEIKKYLNTAHSDIESITPSRYCQNETINLILSGFAYKASRAGIHLTIDVNLPESLPFSDTELSSLLSNALENAIQASEEIPETKDRIINLRLFSKNNKLCIDIRNRYSSEVKFKDDLPLTEKDGHGFGTKSMVNIVEKHGGVYQFSVKDGWFLFQATA